MCGIVATIDVEDDAVRHATASLRHRGPDDVGCVRIGRCAFGHTRLAIIDPTPASAQPMTRGSVTVTYNGELWNYRELRDELRVTGVTFSTDGDTEVVAWALDTWGVDALPKLNGMFALAWTDGSETIYAARDRFGETTLALGPIDHGWMIASERRAFLAAGSIPGRSRLVDAGSLVTCRSGHAPAITRWYDVDATPSRETFDDAVARVRDLVRAGVIERTIADVPVCTLISGGIDSSIVLSVLTETYPDIVAYTAVYNERSADLRAARSIASAYDVELREIPVPLPCADDLSRMVSTIEIASKAQVEIAWPCWHLARAMASDGFRVTYSGEGSDELWASYGFAYHGLKSTDWHTYRKRLFLSQASKNFVRANTVFLAHGVECRLPFLSTGLVEYALALPRTSIERTKQDKAVLRDAFRDAIPAPLVDRGKVAFQDGLGIKTAIASVLANPATFYRSELAKYDKGMLHAH